MRPRASSSTTGGWMPAGTQTTALGRTQEPGKWIPSASRTDCARSRTTRAPRGSGTTVPVRSRNSSGTSVVEPEQSTEALATLDRSGSSGVHVLFREEDHVSCDVHSARGDMDEEKHVVRDEPGLGPDLRGEEVRCGKHIQVRPDEFPPGPGLLSFRRRGMP
mgnify:CR=1 FL=1